MLFTLRLLRPGDCVIDVGANIGLYSLLAASRVGRGRVIALEPDSLAAARLRENTDLNHLRNVELHIKAAGAQPGEAKLTMGLDTINHMVGEATNVPSVLVKVTALDDLVDPGDTVALVKLDTEGFESEVLRGAGRLLAEGRILAWIVEVNGLGLRYGVEDRAVIEIFKTHAYHPHCYHSTDNFLERVAGRSAEGRQNLIFVKEADAVRDRLRSAKI